jgi:hypothetical protein
MAAAGHGNVSEGEARCGHEVVEIRIAGRLRRAYASRGTWFAEVNIGIGPLGTDTHVTVPLRAVRVRVPAGRKEVPATAGAV